MIDRWTDPLKDKYGIGAVRFFERLLTHPKGPLAGRPFRLEGWQRKIVAEVFGTRDRRSGLRRYRRAYCQAWARWVDAEGQVAKLGTIVKTANGNLIQNPYLAVANRALEQMTRLATEFGMTPSSRSRVQVAERDAGPSLADVLFGDALDLMEIDADGEADDADR